jgi:hypothetical protein
VRKFPPSELGFAWLMELVGRSEPRYLSDDEEKELMKALATDAERQRFVRARPLHNRQHVVDQSFVHTHLRRQALQLHDFVACEHRLHRRRCA